MASTCMFQGPGWDATFSIRLHQYNHIVHLPLPKEIYHETQYVQR